MPAYAHKVQSLDVGPLSSNAKHESKDSLLTILNKLGDRDTQQKAQTELGSLVRECTKYLGLLASNKCPVSEHYLQQPFLGKVVSYLKLRLKDPDLGVRETAGDALGQIAQGLHFQHSPLATGDPSTNPVLKAALESALEQKKEVQQAGAYALSKVHVMKIWLSEQQQFFALQALLLTIKQAVLLVTTLQLFGELNDLTALVFGYTQPLVPAVWKTLLKLINNNLFAAKATLIGAIASCEPDTWHPKGILQQGADALQPFLPQLMGHTEGTKKGSTGLLAALRCPDWPVRRATAEAIKALAVALGPQLEAAYPAVASQTMTAAAADALDKCRFDKVRPVRDSVQEAQAVLQDLQEFVDAKQPGAAWQSWIRTRLQGRGIRATSPPRSPSRSPFPGRGGSPSRSPLPGRGGSPPRSPVPGRQSPRSRPVSGLRGLVPASSVHERFFQAAASTDQVAESSALGQQARDPQPDAALASCNNIIHHTPAPHLASSSASSKHECQAGQPIAQPQPSAGSGSDGHHAEANSTTQLSGGSDRTDDAADLNTSQQRAPHTRLDSEDAEAATTVSPSSSHSDSHHDQGQAEPSKALEQDSVALRDLNSLQDPTPVQDSASVQENEGREASWTEEQTLQGSPESSFVSNDASNAASRPLGSDVMPNRTPLAAVQEGYSAAVRSQMSKQSSLQEQGSLSQSQNQPEGSLLRPRAPSRALTKHASIEPRHASSQSAEDWASVKRQMQKMQEQQMRLLGMVESLSNSTQEALGGLDSRLLALEARLQSSLSGFATDSSIAAGHGAVTANNACVPNRDGAIRVEDLDTALQVALSHTQADVAKLLAASSPAWEHLSAGTAQTLLQQLPSLIQDTSSSTFVLPWLWPLADEDNCTVTIGVATQTNILNALSSLSDAEDKSSANKASLLRSTLEMVWSMSDLTRRDTVRTTRGNVPPVYSTPFILQERGRKCDQHICACAKIANSNACKCLQLQTNLL